MTAAVTMIDLRSGTASDLPIVDAIMQRAFDPRFGEAWTRGQCLGILALPGVWLTIASIDGQPAGFALSRATVAEAELLLLASLPDLRRRGVGGALLRSVMRDAAARKAERLFLEVRSGNDAIRLYQTSGFAKVGERRGYYRGSGGQLFDAMTFECILPVS